MLLITCIKREIIYTSAINILLINEITAYDNICGMKHGKLTSTDYSLNEFPILLYII